MPGDWAPIGAYRALRPILFSLPPAASHALALRALGALPAQPPAATFRDRLGQKLPIGAFDAPAGLAAGWDKDATAAAHLHRLGLGHAEIGTVTPRPQRGNDGATLARLPRRDALVNRLGFPSQGATAVAARLSGTRAGIPIGVNVGPNRDRLQVEPVAEAAATLAPAAAWITLNLASPNTPGLRALLTPTGVAEWVGRILEAVDRARSRRPVLVKVHPDVPVEDTVQVSRAALDAGASGVVAVNTTASGEGAPIPGGLSGAPLFPAALERVRAVHRLDPPVLVGVGGVGTVDQAWTMIRAGAHLLQLYTGLIYRGPGLAPHLHRGLVARLDAAGLDRLSEAVGVG